MTNLFSFCEETKTRFSDRRGYLEVLYESPSCVLKRSFSYKNVFRGMHWQAPPHAQTKIIRVVSGRIADFVIPMLAPDRVIHHAIISPEDGWVRIDDNCAHGLFALEDTVFEYFCDGPYAEESEIGLNIVAHIKAVLGVDDVLLSDKDMAATPFPG